MVTDWIPYEPGLGDTLVELADFGPDHWSTLLYLESCAVDKGGKLDNAKMRCNARLHRDFAADHHMRATEQFPTRLRGGRELAKHDDWSCLEDMVALGLVRAWWRQVSGKIFGGSEAKVELTAHGFQIAAQLRQYRAGGGKLGEFAPSMREAAA